MVELMAALVVIAIILLLTLPNFTGNSDKARQAEANTQLAVGYRTARNESLGRANAFTNGSVSVDQLATDMNKAQPQLKVQTTSTATGLKARKLYLLSTGTDSNNLALLFLEPNGVLWKLTAGQTGAPVITKNAVAQTAQDVNYYNTVMNDSPLAFWELTETSTSYAFDELRNSPGVYTGTYTQGSAGALNDVTNKSVLLDGSSGHVFVANNASINPTTRMTFEAWVKPNSVTGTQVIARKDNQFLLMQVNATIAFRVYTGAAVTATTGSVMSIGVWAHVVGTYDGTNVRVYINGVQQAIAAQTGSIPVTASDLYIGRNTPFWGTGFYNGSIDEVALYGTALAAGSVTQHFGAR